MAEELYEELPAEAIDEDLYEDLPDTAQQAANQQQYPFPTPVSPSYNATPPPIPLSSPPSASGGAPPPLPTGPIPQYRPGLSPPATKTAAPPLPTRSPTTTVTTSTPPSKKQEKTKTLGKKKAAPAPKSRSGGGGGGGINMAEIMKKARTGDRSLALEHLENKNKEKTDDDNVAPWANQLRKKGTLPRQKDGDSNTAPPWTKRASQAEIETSNSGDETPEFIKKVRSMSRTDSDPPIPESVRKPPVVSSKPPPSPKPTGIKPAVKPPPVAKPRTVPQPEAFLPKTPNVPETGEKPGWLKQRERQIHFATGNEEENRPPVPTSKPPLSTPNGVSESQSPRPAPKKPPPKPIPRKTNEAPPPIAIKNPPPVEPTVQESPPSTPTVRERARTMERNANQGVPTPPESHIPSVPPPTQLPSKPGPKSPPVTADNLPRPPPPLSAPPSSSIPLATPPLPERSSPSSRPSPPMSAPPPWVPPPTSAPPPSLPPPTSAPPPLIPPSSATPPLPDRPPPASSPVTPPLPDRPPPSTRPPPPSIAVPSIPSNGPLQTQGEPTPPLGIVEMYRRRPLPVVDMFSPPARPPVSTKPPQYLDGCNGELGDEEIYDDTVGLESEMQQNGLIPESDELYDDVGQFGAPPPAMPPRPLPPTTPPPGPPSSIPPPLPSSLPPSSRPSTTTLSSEDALPNGVISPPINGNLIEPDDQETYEDVESVTEAYATAKSALLATSGSSLALSNSTLAPPTSTLAPPSPQHSSAGDSPTLSRKNKGLTKKQQKEEERKEKERKRLEREREKERKKKEEARTKNKLKGIKQFKQYELKPGVEPLFAVEVLLDQGKTKDHLQFTPGEVARVLLLSHPKLPGDRYLVEKEDGTIGYLRKNISQRTAYQSASSVLDQSPPQTSSAPLIEEEDIYESLPGDEGEGGEYPDALQNMPSLPPPNSGSRFPPPSQPAPPPPTDGPEDNYEYLPGEEES